jgi:hypothetical protein
MAATHVGWSDPLIRSDDSPRFDGFGATGWVAFAIIGMGAFLLVASY